jgi:predicted DNA-binding ribbon-helix-helix protein
MIKLKRMRWAWHATSMRLERRFWWESQKKKDQ